MLQNIAIDHPDRVRGCIFSNTWVKADEYMSRVQMTRKRIALAYGAEEYVKHFFPFTNGATQVMHMDKVMEVSGARSQPWRRWNFPLRLDMTLKHDRSTELHRISVFPPGRRHARRRHRAVLSVSEGFAKPSPLWLVE